MTVCCYKVSHIVTLRRGASCVGEVFLSDSFLEHWTVKLALLLSAFLMTDLALESTANTSQIWISGNSSLQNATGFLSTHELESLFCCSFKCFLRNSKFISSHIELVYELVRKLFEDLVRESLQCSILQSTSDQMRVQSGSYLLVWLNIISKEIEPWTRWRASSFQLLLLQQYVVFLAFFLFSLLSFNFLNVCCLNWPRKLLFHGLIALCLQLWSWLGNNLMVFFGLSRLHFELSKACPLRGRLCLISVYNYNCEQLIN